MAARVRVELLIDQEGQPGKTRRKEIMDLKKSPDCKMVPGFPWYTINQNGQVYSVYSNWRGYGIREMVQHLDRDGYPAVKLAKDGKMIRQRIHKLLAITFLGPKPSDRHEIRHIDGNCLNNVIENIAWGTGKDNADDRERHGRTSRGKSHSVAVKKGMKKRGFNVQ